MKKPAMKFITGYLKKTNAAQPGLQRENVIAKGNMMLQAST
jgi:hypothetical protein